MRDYFLLRSELRNMQKFKFDYDKENDDLFLYSGKSKSTASIEIGDIVLDFDKNRGLVGIEIMRASELIKSLVIDNVRINKNLLSNIITCKVDTKFHDNLLTIKMILLMSGEQRIPVNLSVPHITKSSPALRAS